MPEASTTTAGRSAGGTAASVRNTTPPSAAARSATSTRAVWQRPTKTTTANAENVTAAIVVFRSVGDVKMREDVW